MRISHEAIYQALYVQGRGALRRELIACLRTGRALRVPRARTRGRGKKFVSSEVMISERPAEANDRAVPGHWEGDLILGLGSSAIGTLVERTTRFTVLLHLPRMDGHGAEAVRDAIATSIGTLPEQLRRSLAWNEGAEMAQHDQLRIDTGLAIYFCDPQSPWQRVTNENTNGHCASVLPKGTELSKQSTDDLATVAASSTAAPARPSDGRPPPRPSTNTYYPSKTPVLLPPLEPEQFTSIRYGERLAEHGATPSIGSVGDSYDNALAEAVIGLVKTELVELHVPWRTRTDFELAALEYINWFNTARLHGELDHITPREFEEAHYRRHTPALVGARNHT